MQFIRSGMIIATVGALAGCGSGFPDATGDTFPVPARVVDSSTTEVVSATTTQPIVIQDVPADTAPTSIAEYGSNSDGFAVVGAPIGLSPTEVPLTETVGPSGETIVSQRFTAETLNSQVNITRQTTTNTSVLINKFEKAKTDSVADTSSVSVGSSKYPGYLYRDEGSGWLGVMWVLSDDSAMWVLASGLNDDEIMEIARSVEVKP